jgi:RNA-directed DNA polymerase
VSHSRPSLNPTGGDVSRRGLTQPALHEELMARVLDSANVRRAWKRVKANKGASGIDGMRIEDFPAYARLHWPQLRQQLADGVYQPQPVRRVVIPKPQGGERLLGIPIPYAYCISLQAAWEWEGGPEGLGSSFRVVA